MKGPIRVFGAGTPVLPLVKKLSGQKIILGFQWDYANQTRANYKGVKGISASFFQHMAFSAADVVICTTERLKRIAEGLYGKKAFVVPNFVDTDLFKKAPKKGNHILYAGRLHWSKGVDVLIRSFVSVRRNFPETELLICGRGEDLPRLQDLVSSCLDGGVHFLGSVTQERLAQLMATARAFILPTLTLEGHPKALIEAMACGTACIATRVPGNADVIIEGKTGLLVKPGDTEGLAEALNLLITNDSLRESIERNGAQFAIENYSVKSTLRKEIQIIKRMTTQDT